VRLTQSAVASAADVARAASENVWTVLLTWAGLDRRGAIWSAPGWTGTVKLTPLYSRGGVLGAFVNGAPAYERRPFDAPAFCVEFLEMSWPEATAHVLALAAEDQAGPDGAAEGTSPTLPPSGHPVSPELRALADRMTETGIPVHGAALDAALADAATRGPPHLHRQLSRLRRSLDPDGRVRPVWQPEGAVSGRWQWPVDVDQRHQGHAQGDGDLLQGVQPRREDSTLEAGNLVLAQFCHGGQLLL
jgi:hypothetical protein